MAGRLTLRAHFTSGDVRMYVSRPHRTSCGRSPTAFRGRAARTSPAVRHRAAPDASEAVADESRARPGPAPPGLLARLPRAGSPAGGEGQTPPRDSTRQFSPQSAPPPGSAASSSANIRPLCTGPPPAFAWTRARPLSTAHAASCASAGSDLPFLRRAARAGRFMSITSMCRAGQPRGHMQPVASTPARDTGSRVRTRTRTPAQEADGSRTR